MARRGYLWWYLDAISDDGRAGLTVIAFLGSVFSPSYAWARRGGRPADPLDHAAVNVVLWGRHRRWAMTERPAAAVARDAQVLRIGRSRLRWDGDALLVTLDERASPLPLPVRGRIRVHPRGLSGFATALGDDGRHRWRPMAPACRVEVALAAPDWRWSGDGYLDSNDGDAPLEQDVRRWDWSRVADRRGRVLVFYDTFPRAGAGRALALRPTPEGGLVPFEAPPRQRLADGFWRLPRFTRGDPGSAGVERTLLDAPFYARSEITTRIDGAAAAGIGESIDLDRFASPVVQAMLRLRAPRGGTPR